MRLPIRVRLTGWYVSLLAAIVVGLGAFVVLQLRADMQAEIVRDVQRSWTPIAHDYSDDGLDDFTDTSGTLLPRDGVAQVYDSGGRLLASWGDAAFDGAILTPAVRDAALAGGTRPLSIAIAGQEYRAVAGPVERLGQRHAVVVAESMAPVERSVRSVLVLLLLTVPVALAATGFGGWWLARKALLPVQRMTSKAEQVRIDRLHERIAVPPARDEIGHLAVTLNAMLDRLEDGVAEKHRVVADASHELRTPLSVMRAELDVSLRGDELSPPERAVLESVREEVDRMSRTVDNLLTLAQVDEGRLALLRTRVCLGDVIEAAARPLFPLAHAKGVALEVQEGDPGSVDADRDRLHQVLTNLLDNAIKFTPPGGDVRVTAIRRDGEVVVTVTDTGPGIPAAARAHVFDRFVRVDSARNRDSGGSGLGLAICREIATAHGGRVWVDSAEPRGSAFSIALPQTAELARAGTPRRVVRG